MDRARRGSQDETVMLMRDEIIQIADIYVPTKRRATLNPATVEKIAESMLEEGQRSPSWCARMATASSWWKGSTGWKPASPSARRRSRPSSSRRDAARQLAELASQPTSPHDSSQAPFALVVHAVDREHRRETAESDK